MFFLYCTEIVMFRFRVRSGISAYKNICNAILLLKWLFCFIFRSIAFYIPFYIHYKMGRLKFGGRLRGLKI